MRSSSGCSTSGAVQCHGWNVMVACWAAMGVAILTKGLVGIALPGLVLVVYTLITRDWGLWRRLHLTAGAVIMLVIVMPWFYLVAQRNPEFLNFFFKLFKLFNYGC